MFDLLHKLEIRYQELEELLGSDGIMNDKEQYSRYVKELSDLKDTVHLFRAYKNIAEEIENVKSVLKEKHEADFLELAEKELSDLQVKIVQLEQQLKSILKGEDKDLNKNVIIEIRPGTGGMEAGIFVGDLYHMYTKYAARKSWSTEIMSASPTESGGFKEIIFSVQGKEAYKRLKFESGVHRVQRVPTTETQGRIHTSTATVAVLMEPEEVDLVINPSDLRIDTYRSSGPGGQHMQKTDSAVRITHVPSGLVVACQDERSQTKNKRKAMRVLGARLLDKKEQEDIKKLSQARKAQIGTGDRSEKIRTYNFPDRRITDHRINLTLYKMEAVMEGDLDEMSDGLIKAAEEKANKTN